jgi:hypothetical protein
MMEWWNDIRMLCARYLIASEMVDRTGPVEAAVKAAGYNEEDEDELEGEGEGEDDEDVDDDVARVVVQGERWSGEEVHIRNHAEHGPPGYSRPHSFAEKYQPAEPGGRKSVVRD